MTSQRLRSLATGLIGVGGYISTSAGARFGSSSTAVADENPGCPTSAIGTGPLVVAGLCSALAGPFDLAIGVGEAVAITGPSGSGKSLFLRMIADLDPNDGNVALGELGRRSMPAPQWRRTATYVAAESGWWDDTVAAHFATGHRARATALAERLRLKPELMDGPVLRLSTGEKQRFSLIRALVIDPPLLLLDEPTGPLDADSVERVELLLRERLDTGAILLIVTHDPLQASRLGARHLRMEAGRLYSA